MAPADTNKHTADRALFNLDACIRKGKHALRQVLRGYSFRDFLLALAAQHPRELLALVKEVAQKCEDTLEQDRGTIRALQERDSEASESLTPDTPGGEFRGRSLTKSDDDEVMADLEDLSVVVSCPLVCSEASNCWKFQGSTNGAAARGGSSTERPRGDEDHISISGSASPSEHSLYDGPWIPTSQLSDDEMSLTADGLDIEDVGATSPGDESEDGLFVSQSIDFRWLKILTNTTLM